METTASTGLFHGFSRSSHYLKAHKTQIPVCEHVDIGIRNRRKSRKHQRFLLRKTFLLKRLLDKNKSEETSGSVHEEDSCSSCPQTNEDEQETRVALPSDALPAKATLPSVFPPACDYDSGLSLAGSCASSRASSPVSWLNPGKCVAIDCEMVGTGPGGKISELARCSVVNYCGDVVYDKYIKPELPVTNYRTRWSGITRQHLKYAIPFKTAQKEIIQLLKGKWVIGHAVHNDFRAIKYFHPKEKTRDTSKMNLLKQMAGFSTSQSHSLKKLALQILKKRIQVGNMGHSSVEDAQTCMELYKLVEEQVEQDYLCRHQTSDDSNVDEDSTTENQYLDDQYWPSDLNKDSK